MPAGRSSIFNEICEVQMISIFVCTSCGKNQPVPESESLSQGDRLLRQLQTELQIQPPNTSLPLDLTIQSVQCMGVCEQDCAIALMAPGKRTYLFGNLPTDPTQLEATATAVLTCAQQYQAHPEGTLSYFTRPELLKTRVLARIPALPTVGVTAAPTV
jgi:predicted metal-binding protein